LQRFSTALISTHVAVLPWRYDTEIAPKTRYTLRRNTASITKGLNLQEKKYEVYCMKFCNKR